MSANYISQKRVSNIALANLGKVCLILLALPTFVLSSTHQALAHAKLLASQPADRSAGASPKELSLVFNEKAEPIFVKLKASSGQELPLLSKPEQDNLTIRSQVQSELEKGRYTVEFRVVTSDTHPVSGVISFSVE